MLRILMILAACLTISLVSDTADAGRRITRKQQVNADRGARWHNANRSWHGAYGNVQWGRPVALIVPPTATMQTEYSWGVGRTQMRPIQHQFARPVARMGGSGPVPSSPRWPSRTEHLGVYSVRGPW